MVTLGTQTVSVSLRGTTTGSATRAATMPALHAGGRSSFGRRLPPWVGNEVARSAFAQAAAVAAFGHAAALRAVRQHGSCSQASKGARVAATLEHLESQRRSVPWPPTPPPPPSRRPSPGQQDQVRTVQEQAHARTEAGETPELRGPSASDRAAAAAFSRIYNHAEWGTEARSGLGSKEATTREFRVFLEAFLQDHGITSIVDAGCGHWPTGYQRLMNWQGVHYHGIDIVPYVVNENQAHFANTRVLEDRGLASAKCDIGSACGVLPCADLLLVKDVLMHLPNAAVLEFLQNSINVQPSRYRMVMLVQNSIPASMPVRQMVDIEAGQLLPFNISGPPFNADFADIFHWQSDEPKVVQLWEAPKATAAVPRQGFSGS